MRPHLHDSGFRLVGDGPIPSDRTPAARARHAVEHENRRAAINPDLDPTDPRWILAARVQGQLQGSMLTPERRDRILRTARQLGLEPFEASMIIALVQDQARRGGDAQSAANALAELAVRTPSPRTGTSIRRTIALWIASAVLALLGYAALAAWLLAE